MLGDLSNTVRIPIIYWLLHADNLTTAYLDKDNPLVFPVHTELPVVETTFQESIRYEFDPFPSDQTIAPPLSRPPGVPVRSESLAS